MKLNFDINRPYALALEGGGAKGAYQIGVWKALQEAGVRFSAVSGSSVGSLNGALIMMGDVQHAVDVWENITYSKIMDIDDALMHSALHLDWKNLNLKELFQNGARILRDGGMDVEPLRRLIADTVDEEAIRNSDTEFYVMTYSVTDRKELDVDMKKVPAGEMGDMLLASAYFPAFKHEKLGGKLYTDGGVQDLVPLDCLIKRGYPDIILVRIFGLGVEKKVVIPEETTVNTIAPRVNLGPVLDFDPAQSKRNLQLGYYDGLRFLYGLTGRDYYFDRNLTEQEAFGMLCEIIRSRSLFLKKEPPALRRLTDKILPALARELSLPAGADYNEFLETFLESSARELGLPQFQVVTERLMLEQIYGALASRKREDLPKFMNIL